MTMPDPVQAWRRLREVEGCRASLIDLYQLVASQGMAAHQLPPEQRRRLAEFAVSQDWPGFSITTGSDRGPDPIEVAGYDPGWPATSSTKPRPTPKPAALITAPRINLHRRAW